MTKSSLIKLLATAGIIIIDTSCDMDVNNPYKNQENDSQYCLKKYLDTNDFVPFTALEKIKLNNEITKKIICITKLSDDVFNNPDIAKAFNENPKQYLRSIGLGDVDLDMNSIEVKSALALGDIDVQEAIKSNNINKYIELIGN